MNLNAPNTPQVTPEMLDGWKRQFEREIANFKKEFEKDKKSGEKFSDVQKQLDLLAKRTNEIDSNEMYLMFMSELHLLENRFRDALKDTQISLSDLKKSIGNGKKPKTMFAQGEISPEVYAQVAEAGRAEASENATAGAQEFFGKKSWIAKLIDKATQA